MNEQLSYKSLAPHVKYLRAAGLFRLSPDSPKRHIFFHTIYLRWLIAFFSVYTVQQILKIYEVRDDVNKVMDTMFLFITNTDCIYKAAVLQKKPEKIEELLNTMKGPIFNLGVPEHRPILLATVKKALLLVHMFNRLSLITCFLWALHPTIMHMQGNPIEFAVWLPFDANQDPQFYIAVVYVWIQTSWLAYSNTTMDIFIAFLLEQCRTQVSILRLDLESVVQKSKEEAARTSSPYSEILERRFGRILIHHNEIVNSADKIQDIFGGAVFYQFVIGGWILCCSAYRIVNTQPASVEFVSMLMYTTCIVVEIFVYCFFGNELFYESNKLMDSAYAVDWLEIPVKQRRSLIIFMERVKRPICPTAGSMIPLSNSTFVSILRSAYSCYAFLRNSEH
ncbi:hypothetical protein ABMA28_001599 [Loxostege sticticalis]|uniref:Odorant receptor n=1 Tax=Loxostege sticticalis TaxID=481309 RepID=A0ABD0T6E2_LOXSC